MNILILNSILFTAEKGIIPEVPSIKDTMIYNMCLGFLKLGHQVTLAAAKEYTPARAESYDFEVLFFPSKYTRLCPPSVLPCSPALRKYLKANHHRFDLVISSEVFSFNSLFAARICPKKTIVWQELTEHQRKFHKIPSRIWHGIIVPLAMRKIKRVVPRSMQAYNFIRNYLPQTSRSIADHGINTEKFLPCTEKKRQIISSSQLIYRKNVDGIIRIFQQFHRQKGYEDIKLLIAGRGDEEVHLRNLTEELGLQDYVTFLGFLPQQELNKHIRESYCFLVNTRKDLNMVSIPEAIASATPILTNMQPASTYYIINEKLGIAKDNWGTEELKEIIDNNPAYVRNCIGYREKLTNTYSAQLLIDNFNNP